MLSDGDLDRLKFLYIILILLKKRKNMPINYLDLPIGSKYPYEVDCVVEIGKDTNVKYEYDEHLHEIGRAHV